MIYETKPETNRIKLENENLRVIILPHMGGRIVSLFHKEKSFEAAAQPGTGMRGAAAEIAGVDEESICGETAESGRKRNFAPYAYGMDEAFPNIDEENFTWKGHTRHYPDHGEIWQSLCRICEQGQTSAELEWNSPDFGYCYEKKLCLEGDSLRIHYRITNFGKEELPAIWTWHGLMRYEEDMEIILPEGAEQFRNVLDGPVLGKEGSIYPLKNEKYDFTKVPGADSCCMVKYYVGSAVTEGRCGFYYPSADISCSFQYDAAMLPYLGVWITAGGFQGDYNCALEPTNGFYDSIGRAAGNGKLPVIGAGEVMEFDLRITIAAKRAADGSIRDRKENLIRPVPAETPSAGQRQQIERKFGMFLHFGVNTFGNVEWSDGTIPAESYRPGQIDADQWIRTAREAGMNFVVLVTKHHDGFCMWDTDSTRYSVRYSGNPTDVVADTAKACKKYGVKLGLYYSLWDRNAESYRNDFENSYISYMLGHLTELMDGRYGEIVELWLDGQWDKTRKQWQLDRIYDVVKRMQPGCQIGVNGTVGVDDDRAAYPDEYYLPEKCREGDPLRMFPSDFRLWDPHPCREGDPKIYTFQGERYYLPFEMTICSRQGRWFYSDTYEDCPFTDVETAAADCQRAFDEKNIAVINMPPNTEGRLVEGDIVHLMEIAGKLH